MNISVIIPTYNRYELLKRAIESVMKQTYKVKEILVIDDGSTDETIQIKKLFPSVRYFYQKNSGVSTARNLGIKKASCEWIAFLDSDDVWNEKKLQEQCLIHEKYPELLMSYTDEVWVRNNNIINIPKKFRKVGNDIFSENISYCNIAPSSVLMHRSIFQVVGMFDENFEVCEDYDLWLRISLNYKIMLLNQKLIIKYAGHENQLSFKYYGMDRFRVKTLEKLLNIDNISDNRKEFIRKELHKKYILLLKGAKKHMKTEDIEIYSLKLHDFRLF